MSREYHRSRERSSSNSSKLRMDLNLSSSQLTRSHRESFGNRKEFDSVMRKARESKSNYWNKKLLEVEERDPNRWRHSGYKEMYIGCSISSGDSKNYPRSPRNRRPDPRSPQVRSPRPRSPKSPHARSPYATRERTPLTKTSRSPRCKGSRARNSHTPRLRSPISRRSHSPKVESLRIRKSHTLRSRSPRVQRERPNTNKKRSNKSPSCESTCSDGSCSLCSVKDNRQIVNPSRSSSRTVSPTRSEFGKNAIACASSRLTIERPEALRQSLSRPSIPPPLSHISEQQFQESNNLSKGLKMIKKDKHRRKLSEDQGIPDSIEMMQKQVKLEKIRTANVDASLIHPSVESSPSNDSDSSSGDSHKPSPKMALSERFGKMAQWSIARRDMENMRITRIENNTMKVVIDGEQSKHRFSYDSASTGYYSDSLLTQNSWRLQCWDDVRVRYDYYKSRGYLGDLSLHDYIKWEEWWCRYQEWLEAERYYEQWAVQAATGGGSRKRRRRNNTGH